MKTVVFNIKILPEPPEPKEPLLCDLFGRLVPSVYWTNRVGEYTYMYDWAGNMTTTTSSLQINQPFSVTV